jgi:HAD superfamily hydrolase (TIGR01509 family)
MDEQLTVSTDGAEAPTHSPLDRIKLPQPLQAVVCDMDGLLIDSEAAHQRTMVDAARDLGFDFPEDLFMKTVGVDRVHNRAIIAEAFGPDFPLERFYEDSDTRFEAMVREGIPLRPGARELFATFDRLGLRRAVATSTMRDWAIERLTTAGFIDRVDALVTFNDVDRPKPAPDPYLKAVSLLGATPEGCLALEDSHNGVRAASAAGLATIMVPDLLPPTEETDRLVVGTLPSLFDVAELLERRLS